ncbi:hypothetical protein KY336_04205, partial [Candidatus Woesearchaeota archaeon]|nr:hypothetical protein [Candidatus Woesearchaeota archaeon]
MLKPEVYFLRYAYPCAKDLLGKSLKQEDIDKMRNSVLENSPLPREYLEGIFKNAIKGMKKINASDYWSIETIRAYFWIEHEKNLQHLEKMPMLKERCLVKRGKINEQLKHGFYKVQFTDGKTRNITLELLPEARLGDDVLVHRAHAVEKVYDKVNVYCFGNPHLSSDNLAMRLADKIELDGYT